MGFKETVLFMMNMVNKSLQLELNNFFATLLKKDFSVSKQAYSKARQNINPELFVELTDTVVKGFYECDDCKTWNKYRLLAIDGTILEIPNSELLRQEYGSAKNQNSEVARAKAVCLYDVQNKLILKSKIDRYNVTERKMAKHLISEILLDISKKDLILFDRGYPSAELISFLTDNG
ncbi:MAG: transposase, partial [Clostridia bacterium]|nr:transposase [Clostridia bacterium]